MMLREAIEQYVLWRRAHGAKFATGQNVLRQFLGHADGDAECDAVSTAQVLAFLAGARQLTRNRENKYYTLAGFWRHAISRGHATRSPLPNSESKSPPRTPPYIYSRDELQRLLDPVTVASSRRGAVQFDAVTFRTLLLLLYGAGLRFSEATALTIADVDLAEHRSDHSRHEVLQEPSGSDRTAACNGAGELHTWRRHSRLAQDETSYFLANRDGTRLASSTVQDAFDRLRRVPGSIARRAGDRSRACTT